MADDPADRPRRPPSHGSVVGLDRPPRGDGDTWAVPLPLPHDSDQHTEPSPLAIPKHGGHVWIRADDGWTAGLCTAQDRVGRRVWCTWTAPGRVDTLRVEGWVSWDDVRPAAAEQPSPPW